MMVVLVEYSCHFPNCDARTEMAVAEFEPNGWRMTGGFTVCPEHSHLHVMEIVDAINFEFQKAALEARD